MVFVRPLLNKIIKKQYASIDAEAGAPSPFRKKYAKPPIRSSETKHAHCISTRHYRKGCG
jgi:hypothetical protein